MKSSFSKNVYMDGNLIKDVSLNREIEIKDSLTENLLRELNSMYFLNIESPFVSFMKNIPYRIDLSGTKFMLLLGQLLLALFNVVKYPIISFVISFLLLTRSYLALSIILVIFNSLLSISLHEVLHIYFYRIFTRTKDSGIVILQGIRIFVLFVPKKLSVGRQLIVSGAPALIGTIIGIIIFLCAIVFTKIPLVKILLFFMGLPWIIQVLNFLPFTTDCKGIIYAFTKN